MGETKTLASKVDDESELFERFERFEDETGYGNRSKALRAALRRGLDAYEAEDQDQRSHTPVEGLFLSMASFLAAGSIFLLVLAFAGIVPLSAALDGGFASLVVAAAFVVVVWSGAVRRATGAVRRATAVLRPPSKEVTD